LASIYTNERLFVNGSVIDGGFRGTAAAIFRHPRSPSLLRYKLRGVNEMWHFLASRFP
jgi:hypothetical protein